MTEIITHLSKTIEYCHYDDEDIHKLTIQTIKNDKKWTADIAIHIPRNPTFPGSTIYMPAFLCDLYLDDNVINEEECQKIIGKHIIKKTQLQIDNHTPNTPPFTKSHFTKLTFELSDHTVIAMRIGEVYDIHLDNSYEHSGGDHYLK